VADAMIEAEFSKVEQDICTGYAEWQGNSESNVAVGVAGAVLLWPVRIAIDNDSLEEVEINALRHRSECVGTRCPPLNKGGWT
jgi:hypothetical protein